MPRRHCWLRHIIRRHHYWWRLAAYAMPAICRHCHMPLPLDITPHGDAIIYHYHYAITICCWWYAVYYAACHWYCCHATRCHAAIFNMFTPFFIYCCRDAIIAIACHDAAIIIAAIAIIIIHYADHYLHYFDAITPTLFSIIVFHAAITPLLTLLITFAAISFSTCHFSLIINTFIFLMPLFNTNNSQ